MSSLCFFWLRVLVAWQPQEECISGTTRKGESTACKKHVQVRRALFVYMQNVSVGRVLRTTIYPYKMNPARPQLEGLLRTWSSE